MKKHLTKVLALAMAAAMMLSACGNSAPAETPSTPADPSAPATSTPAAPATPAEPAKNEITDLVLGRIASRELSTFNYLYTQSAEDSESLAPIWEGLLATNRVGQSIPCIAKEWGTNDGGKTWTIKLRDNATWVDINGEVKAQVTANDFATGLEWVMNAQKNQNNNTSMPSEMLVGAKEYNEWTASLSEAEAWALNGAEGSKFREMVGMEIVDDYTIVYHCVSEKPYFDTLLSYYGMYPIHQDLVDSLGVEGIRGMNNTNMWFNGPYIMTEYVNGNTKTFEPNPHYWDDSVKRFNSATIRMIESWDVGFQLYQNGEIDYCSLTEAMVKTISEDPSNPNHTMMAPDWPSAYSYQMHFNYNKMNEDGSEDTNWNYAAANENFRRAFYYGLDLTEYWKRTNRIDPLSCENVCFMGRDLCWTSDGKDYTLTMRDKLGLPAQDGVKPMRFDATKGADFKAKAMEELAGIVTFPVEVDYYIQGSNQSALDSATVLSNIFSNCLGDDFVKLNICTYVSSLSKEVRDPHLQSFVINGWGADYKDPQNFLGQLTYDEPNAYYSNYYNNINDVAENENTKALIDTFKEFTAMVNEADKITTDMDARYNAYMDAEVYALEHAIVVPFYYSAGWCLTNYDIFGEFAGTKLINWVTNSEGFTGEQITASKTAMGK